MKTNFLKFLFLRALIFVFTLFCSFSALVAQTITSSPSGLYTATYSTSGTYTFTVPASVTEVTIHAWGGGGAGGSAVNRDTRGGGGAGGQFVRKALSVTPNNTYTVTVANQQGNSGTVGNDSWFGSTSAVIAKGGAGGTNASSGNATPAGASGSTSGGIGDVVYRGGNGGTGDARGASGGGGGGAGSTNNGGNTTNNLAGTGTTLNGGNGGAGVSNGSVGNGGSNYGGGGSGGAANNNTQRAGGAGAQGLVLVTWQCNTISLTSASTTTNQNICQGNSIINITYSTSGATGATITGLPIGVNGTWSNSVVTISGTPENSQSGTFNYIVTLTGGNCATTATGTITVNPLNTVSSASSTPTLCQGTLLSPSVTFTTTGATGIGSHIGLPAGLTATWSSSVITISGTPTQTGTFNYSIPLIGGCGTVAATGSITVAAAPDAGTLSGTQSICVGNTSRLTSTASGGTWSSSNSTVATVDANGDVTGVGAGSATISYIIAGTGGCSNAVATIVITVTEQPNAGSISGLMQVCSGSTVTLTTNGTAGGTWSSSNTSVATVSSGQVTGISDGTTTISYSFPASGGCLASSSTYNVTVLARPVITSSSLTVGKTTYCVNETVSTFSVSATGTDLSYQWYSNSLNSNSGGTLISGATLSSYTPSSAVVGDLYYYVVVSSLNGCSQVSSVSSKVTIDGIIFNTQPSSTNQSYCQNATGVSALTATLSSSSGNPTFQWFSTTTPVNTGGVSVTAAGLNSANFTPPVTAPGELYYYVVATKSGGGCNTGSSSVSGKITVNRIPSFTNTPLDQSIIYGADTQFTSGVVSFTGNVSYQWQEQVSGSSTWSNISDNGTYSGTSSSTLSISKPSVSFNGNSYRLTVTGSCGSVTSDPASLTITKKSASVTPDAGLTKVYDSADPAFTGTLLDFASGDNVTATYTREVGETVGTYTISAALAPESVLSNYDITYNTATFTIVPMEIVVSADAKSKTYGAVDPALTYVSVPEVGSTLANGSSVSFSGELSRVAGENVGAYGINSTLSNSNYSITYNTATFTITPKSITVTANNLSKAYGTLDPGLTYSSAPSLVNGDIFTGTLSRTAGENVGTYTINRGSLALSNNYTLTFTGGTFTITQAELIVIPTATSKIYGDTDPVFAFTTSPAAPTTGTLGRASGDNVGEYAYTLGTLNAGANYTIRMIANPAKFSISRKSISASFTASHKAYDGNANATVISSTLSGTVGSDVVTLTGGSANFNDEKVGNDKPVTLTGAILTGDASGNYSLTTVATSKANITKKDVTITPSSSSKIYGDTYTFPSNSASINGLVNPNDISAIVLSSAGASATATIGNYDIEVVQVNGNNISNYNINKNKGVLAVNKRNVSVAGAQTADKVYDATTNVVITGATISGTIAGDQISLVTSASFASPNVGASVAILPNFGLAGAAANNYNLVQPALAPKSITKRPLVITAVDDIKVYDSTKSSLKTPKITTGEVVGTDVPEFIQEFSDSAIGVDKTITPSGRVQDGNNGNNYSYVFIPIQTGKIVVPVALPATLINFTVKPTTDSKVALAWTTSSESSNHGFRLERQIEGQNKWEKIGFVASKAPGGNSNRILNYAYTDMDPKLGAVILYRLAQEDIDGKVTFSEIKAVKLDGRPVATISPNPSAGNITIKRVADGRKMDVYVVDVAGRVVQQTLGVTESEFRLYIPFNGLYSIRMVYPESGEQNIQRVVIQK